METYSPPFWEEAAPQKTTNKGLLYLGFYPLAASLQLMTFPALAAASFFLMSQPGGFPHLKLFLKTIA